MKNRPIRWQLSIRFAGIALLATLLLGGIMITILARYFAIQESNYLTETADDVAGKFSSISGTEEFGEILEVEGILQQFSFYLNGQIRILDVEGNVLADSGFPQESIQISFDKEFEKESSINFDEIKIDRIDSNPISNWLFGIQQADLKTEEKAVTPRSPQVITQPYFNQQGELVGYVELSNGPAFGREVLRSVASGWAVAAILSTLLAALTGVWISRRFSAPLESLAQTTAQMAGGDLSARVKLERQDEFGLLGSSFNQMAESVEIKVEALQRFVADAAHQLGTPLTALRTNLDLIEDEHISAALDQVQRMDELTKSLLVLSQLEAVEPQTFFDEVDLAKLLDEFSEPYASRAEQAELGFSVEIEADSHLVKGDRDQLRILIENLIENAVKFTPPGSEVGVKLESERDGLVFTVEDSGIGILEEDIPRLFSRFHRGRNVSGYPGNGLGLAIVKTIADQHGAEIEIKRKTKGTMVKIRFDIR
jgi:signal transduction histidine kinase